MDQKDQQLPCRRPAAECLQMSQVSNGKSDWPIASKSKSGSGSGSGSVATRFDFHFDFDSDFDFDFGTTRRSEAKPR
jgi:hypothetical protein